MCKIRNLIICILALIFCIPNVAYAKNTREYSYNYDFWGRVIEDIPFFELYKTIGSENIGDVKISSMDDVEVSGDKVYIVDSIESRLNVFDKDLKLLKSIKLVNTKDGKIAIDKNTNSQVILKAPEGVFVHEQEEEIYIADTGNQRIIVLDSNDYAFKRAIGEPKNMIGSTVFKPSKIVVDKINRIYIVVQSGFEGIIELNQDGDFSRYFGVNSPKVNLIEHYWRSKASDEQKRKMKKVLAPSFNNIEIDQEGFIYATTSDATAEVPIYRFNPKGENVLRAKKQSSYPWGDLLKKDGGYVMEGERESKFIDVAVTDYGTYAVLDKENGRIFIYSFDGDLMNIFGGKGFFKDEFLEPTAIDWLGDKLIITDKSTKKAYVFSPTEYGNLALRSSKAYFNGEWDKSAEYLKKAVEINGNYEMAYSLIGKSYLMKEDFEKAMYYFKLGQNREYYSKAFDGYRNIWIEKNFVWIFALIILSIVWIILSERKYFKSKKV